MRLREIEARIAKLEAAHRADPFAGMTEEELERELSDCMDRLAAEHGGDYAATAAALRADHDPASQQAADGFLWFIERQRKQAEYQTWLERTLAEQQAISAPCPPGRPLSAGP